MRRRGLTIAEVLVSSAIFCGLLVALVLIERMSAQSLRQGEASGDTYQMAMLAVNRLKAELRGARIAEVADHELRYQVPELDAQGNVVVDRLGMPQWLPVDPDVRTFNLNAGGDLILSEGDQSKRVARLGEKGQLTFSMPASSGHDLLQINVHAEIQPKDPRQISKPYDAAITLFLSNRL